MQVVIAAIIGALITAVGSIVGRVLTALGIGVVTYVGIGSTVDWLMDQATSKLHTLPPQLLQLIAYLGVGEFLSIISGAISVKLLASGLKSDSVKKWVKK